MSHLLIALTGIRRVPHPPDKGGPTQTSSGQPRGDFRAGAACSRLKNKLPPDQVRRKSADAEMQRSHRGGSASPPPRLAGQSALGHVGQAQIGAHFFPALYSEALILTNRTTNKVRQGLVKGFPELIV